MTPQVASQAHVIVEGRVQGVCFRMSVQSEAQKLSLFGWVRNLPNGGVEAVFHGPHDQVQSMIDYVHQGPTLSRVLKVTVNWQEPESGFSRFEIQY